MHNPALNVVGRIMPLQPKTTFLKLRLDQPSALGCNAIVADTDSVCYCNKANFASHRCDRHCEMKMVALGKGKERCNECIPMQTSE